MKHLIAYYYLTNALISDITKKYLLFYMSMMIFFSSFIVPYKLKRLKLLMLSHRIHPHALVEKEVMRKMKTIVSETTNLIVPDMEVPDAISKNRSIVLKPPRLSEDLTVIERGVLLIKFSTTFKFFLVNVDCELLQKYFILVLEPSWAGYCLPEIFGWIQTDNPIVIQCSERQDYDFIRSLESNLVPVRFGSSDWVDHTRFFPVKGVSKKYDVVYVSNYNSIKRNHVYVRAISKIKKEGFKAALVCNTWGDSKSSTVRLIDYYRLGSKLDLYEALSQEGLNELLSLCKVNVLLSLKEGSNRSIFESMFADIPCLVTKDNIGVNKEYINSRTGKLIDEENLTEEILEVSQNISAYSPRDWAMENISIFSTKEKLDNVLREASSRHGWSWTVGVALKINSPEANYFDKSQIGVNPASREICEVFKLGKSDDEIESGILKLWNKYWKSAV